VPRKAKGPKGEELEDGLFYHWGYGLFRIQSKPGMEREWAGPHKGRAQALLKQRRAELTSGTHKPKQRRVKDLDDLARRWRDSEDPDAMPSLRANYVQYQLHLSPRLGRRDPESVRPFEVFEVLFEDAYKVTGLSAASVHNLRGTLSAIYEFGRFQELVDSNPCRRIPKGKLPSKRKQKRPCYSDVQAFRLMSDDAVPSPVARILRPGRVRWHALR
jgi:hypothetical protein